MPSHAPAVSRHSRINLMSSALSEKLSERASAAACSRSAPGAAAEDGIAYGTLWTVWMRATYEASALPATSAARETVRDAIATGFNPAAR